MLWATIQVTIVTHPDETVVVGVVQGDRGAGLEPGLQGYELEALPCPTRMQMGRCCWARIQLVTIHPQELLEGFTIQGHLAVPAIHHGKLLICHGVWNAGAVMSTARGA